MSAWRTRRLDHVKFPYVFADATYLKGRVNGQVVSRAVVVVTGVAMTGEREVLSCAVGDTETEAAEINSPPRHGASSRGTPARGPAPPRPGRPQPAGAGDAAPHECRGGPYRQL